MKKCQDIETLLPFYPEGALTDAQKRDVEDHLAACTTCQKELAYLKKAGQLVNAMPEVPEPPWFQQKIMAQVRKEAEKRSFAQKWFYPLRIKVPLQIMATIVIAVLAVYIYRSGDDQVKQILPGVQPPVVEMQKEQMPPPLSKTPGVAAPAAPGPKVVLRDEAGRDKEALPDAALGSGDQQSVNKESKPAPGYEEADGNAKGLAEKKDEKPIAALERPEEQLSAQADVSPSVQVAPKGRITAKTGLSDQEKKADDRMISGTAKKKESYKMAAPAAPRSMTASLAGTPQLSVSLHVEDVIAAAADIEKMLVVYDAKISSRQMLEGRVVLRIELTDKHWPIALSKLKEIGQVFEKNKLYEVSDQKIIIILEIIRIE